MSTRNPRLNVVLEPTLYGTVRHLAKREGTSLSLMARDLIKEAVELYEDMHWQEAARNRDKTFSRRHALSHKDIWK